MKDFEIAPDNKATLDDVCEFIVDCLHKTAPTQPTGYPSIRTPNVGRGRLLLDGVNRVSEDVYAEWTKRAVPMPGDLIMAREAPAGGEKYSQPAFLTPRLVEKLVLNIR